MPVDKMTERQIQTALASYVDWTRMTCIPNLCRWHEMDFAALTKAGYLWEYEIKVDQRDWDTDNRKDLPRDPRRCGCPTRNLKYVKRFHYVYARGLVCPEWVDEGVGLIEASWQISGGWRHKKGEQYVELRQIRRPMDHKVEKVPEIDQHAMFVSAYNRFWRLLLKEKREDQ